MNEADQSIPWLVIVVSGVLFFLAFMLHSFLPILLIVPLIILSMRKEKPEQYSTPPVADRASASHTPSPSAEPKETSPWENEQPIIHYPEQLPPM